MNNGDRIQHIYDDVREIKIAMFGRDGDSEDGGLLKEVKTNSDFRKEFVAQKKIVLGAVGSGWLLWLVTMVLQFSGGFG